MAELTRRLNYAYTYNPNHYGDRQHTYELVGRDGAIHFHVTESLRAQHPLPSHYGGLEEHRRVCPAGDDRPPTHTACRLLGGNCWHDGTSSYASEVLIPRWQLDFPDHDSVFRWLTYEYNSRFLPGDADGN